MKTKEIIIALCFIIVGANAMAQSREDLHKKIIDYGILYITVPPNIDEYTSSSISRITSYFNGLGMKVYYIQSTYKVNLQQLSQSTSAGILTIQEVGKINESHKYLLAAVNYLVGFSMYGGTHYGFKIAIYDPFSDDRWLGSIYPMPRKYKEFESMMHYYF